MMDSLTLFVLITFVVVFVAGAIVFALNKKDRGHVPEAMDYTRRSSGSAAVALFVLAFIILILIPGVILYTLFH